MSPPTEAAVRTVGTFTAACVLVSNAVGSGIFTTTGFMARDLGDPLWILGLWAAGGALALAGAMSYSELGAALPRVGGEYVYLGRAFGPLWGFLSGWISLTIGFSAAIAAAAVGFSQYALALAPSLPIPPLAIALMLVWGLTAVHALGVEAGGSFQRWITVAKIGGIGLLLLAAWVLGAHPSPLSTLSAGVVAGDAAGDVAGGASLTSPGIGALAISLVFVLYSYSGWNAAGYIAGEIRDPGRSLPRAMIGGTVFISLLYLAVNLFYFHALPVSELAAEPVLPVAEKAAQALLGPGAAAVVSGVLCVSIAGATSSMIWAGPRVTLAMAQDDFAPAALARTTEAQAPRPALLLQGAWITLLLLSGSFEQLVVYGGVALAVSSALAVAGVIVLRFREPELPRPYRVSGYPFVPLAYIGASLLIAGFSILERPLESLLSLGTVGLGVPVYLLWNRFKQRRPNGRSDPRAAPPGPDTRRSS